MADETVDLRELLSRPMSDFPDLPDLPPRKDFFGKITGIQSKLSTQKQTPFFQIDAKLTDPGPNVTDADLKAIKDGGFSLGDYTVNANFYLTPNAIRMFRRFLTSIGFAENLNFVTALKLDENLNPTEETMKVLVGRDVVCRTQAADQASGRVYNNLDMMSGVQKEGDAKDAKNAPKS